MTGGETSNNSEQESLVGPEPQSKESENESAATPDEILPPEILEELDPQQRKFIERSMLFMGSASAQKSSPLAKKINAKHIDKIIDNSDKENERQFKTSQASERTKRYGMVAGLILVGLVFLYAGQTKDRELAEKIFIGALSGAGGYGIGKSK